MANEIQQQFYYAKYDSTHDDSSNDANISCIDKNDNAVNSVFETSANKLVSDNISIVQNNESLASYFGDFSRFISSTYFKIASNFRTIGYNVTSQSAANSADKQFEQVIDTYALSAQNEIDRLIEKAQKLVEEEQKQEEILTDEQKNLRQEIQNKGFSNNSVCYVQTNSDEDTSFVVINGKYMVNGNQVDEQTFLNEYNNAIQIQQSGKFDKPEFEHFDKLYCKDNNDGTFSTKDWTKREYVYDYNGSIQYQVIDCDDQLTAYNNKTGRKAPRNDEILNGAEIKDNSGNIIFTKKNNKYYDKNGQEVEYWQVSNYIDKNEGITVKMGLYKPNSFGI
ncbi:MAG: hypothetical protein MJ237_08535 [bacterium]|nr:hypothetical protein [bacterium]